MEDFARAKLYSSHALPDGSWHIWIMETMLEFSSWVLPMSNCLLLLLVLGPFNFPGQSG